MLSTRATFKIANLSVCVSTVARLNAVVCFPVKQAVSEAVILPKLKLKLGISGVL